MTDKVVYCNIGTDDQKRCKRIKYTKVADLSDSECIKMMLNVACDRDAALRAMMNGKLPVLQQRNEKINQYCDIDDDEEIENESVIKVILVRIDKPQTSTVPHIYHTINTEEIGEVVSSFVVPVLKPADVEQLLSEKNSICKGVSEIDENDGQKLNITKTVEQQDSFSKNYPPTTKKRRCLPSVSYPVRLPPLTDALKNLKAAEQVYENQSKFIQFWSSHLETLTNGEPTKTDYQNYATTIVDHYPELRGGKTNNYELVRIQISRCIRNRRYAKKQKLTYSESQPINKRKITLQDVTPTINTESKQLSKPSSTVNYDDNADEALEALQKCKPTDESSHVKRLFKATQSIRRAWIEKEADDIQAIIARYPQLTRYSLILYEFCTIQDKNEIALYALMEKLIIKLGQHFMIVVNSEASKGQVMERLHGRLTQLQYRKVNEPLIKIEEAGKSTSALLTAEGSAPRLVLYMAEERIAEAFVVANGARVKVPDPTVAKAVTCLFAVYYVWHRKCPSAYCNTLQYIDMEIMRSPMSSNNRIARFNRDIEHGIAKHKSIDS